MNYLIISCVCLLIKFASFENSNLDALNMSNITINHSKIGQMNSTQEEENSLKLKLENFRNLINTFYFPLIVTIGLIGNTLIIIILRVISLNTNLCTHFVVQVLDQFVDQFVDNLLGQCVYHFCT